MLSRTQIREADRVGGIELMIPWPAGLRLPAGLDDDEERPATPLEHAAAMALVAADCEANGLVPVRVSAARTQERNRPGRPMRYYLAVVIIGRRWVHARGAPDPLTMWAPDPEPRQ